MKSILLIEDDSELCTIKEKELSENLPYPILVAIDFNQVKNIIDKDEREVFIALLDYQLDGTADNKAFDYLSSKSIHTIVYAEKFCSQQIEKVLE